jgi:multiple antibiotic resistance protein
VLPSWMNFRLSPSDSEGDRGGGQMKDFWFTFVALFIAVDVIGTLPIFIGLTESLDRKKITAVVVQSVSAALIAGLLFLAIGNTVLHFVGITIADFMIAGGLLLFVLSLRDLLSPEKRAHQIDGSELGAVPIGVPLIVGPAVLATGILLVDQHGLLMTSLALCANVVIAGVVFWFSPLLLRVLGKPGARVVSKLANILLAAFAVMIIRKGIQQYISQGF